MPAFLPTFAWGCGANLIYYVSMRAPARLPSDRGAAKPLIY